MDPERRPVARWSVRRARKALGEAQHRIASGTGTSDRTLARISALSAEEAALTRDAFVDALRRAGWSEKRIDTALARVESTPIVVRVSRVKARFTALPSWAKVAFAVGAARLPYVGPIIALAVAAHILFGEEP